MKECKSNSIIIQSICFYSQCNYWLYLKLTTIHQPQASINVRVICQSGMAREYDTIHRIQKIGIGIEVTYISTVFPNSCLINWYSQYFESISFGKNLIRFELKILSSIKELAIQLWAKPFSFILCFRTLSIDVFISKK